MNKGRLVSRNASSLSSFRRFGTQLSYNYNTTKFHTLYKSSSLTFCRWNSTASQLLAQDDYSQTFTKYLLNDTTTTSGGVEGPTDIKAPDSATPPPPSVDLSNGETTVQKLMADGDETALLPREIVKELDKHIIGQADAKRAVAVALRNRWRRRHLKKEQADEIVPKNILMIGPTGVGKTEIARRLAKLTQAPFIKVEATKFTEVGFHGRDVDQIIKDLLDVAVHDVTVKEKAKVKEKIKEEVEEKILELLVGQQSPAEQKESFRQLLRSGSLESQIVEVKIPTKKSQGASPGIEMQGIASPTDVTKLIEQLEFHLKGDKAVLKKTMTIKECRPVLEDLCIESKLSKDDILKKAVYDVENNGIVFIDEIDKICIRHDVYRSGADASSEGVQRDLLPLIEGTTIQTKFGNVDTTKILFIASGAFHECKPADLLAELQGRLPIRVQLKALTKNDIFRILTETHFNQIDQAEALLKTEGVTLKFTEDAVRLIADLTFQVNEIVENIGARRLYTVLERILEDISFECTPGDYVVDEEKVRKNLSDMLLRSDLSKYIL